MSTRWYADKMREPRWLSDREMHAWLGYRRMRLLLHLQLDRDLMSQSGLSEQDYDVLSNLSEAAGQRMRLTDLAGHMRWSKSRLSHHITRMRQRGLVDREECAEDGRGSMLVLTRAGQQAISRAAPGHVESVRKHFIDVLTDDEIDALAALSHRVVERLNATVLPPRRGED
jgi:DNA-binding MarR family transcriptional regulator